MHDTAIREKHHENSRREADGQEPIGYWYLRSSPKEMIMAYRKSFLSAALSAVLLITIPSAQAHDESKYPDWSGQWRRMAEGPPRYDTTKGYGRAQQPPLTEEYRQIHEKSLADQAEGGQGLYRSSAKCLPMGMPWQMYGLFPLEFVITPSTTFVLAEIMTQQPRRIYTDGRSWPGDDQDPLFTGVSMGNWIDTDGDGKYDMLEIETRYLRVPRIYDQSGIPFHEDGQAVIRERIYLDKADPNLIHNEITTTDHALTSPWKVVHSYRREKKVIWIENNCVEGNDNIAIGNEDYLLSPDGFLMPVKKGQQPPDLRYFKDTGKP
jgi:hypothetical protein